MKILEKISILSLSLMLVSTFAVAPALPAMIADFSQKGYGEEQVAFLITVTSFAIMISLLLDRIWTRFLSETAIISLGLGLIALGGSLPLLTSVYAPIFMGRLVLGLGLGMINARAINMVSTHYRGQERLHMMGLRGSAEVLGSASLTALVGVLLPFGWSRSFAIYLIALIVLLLFWCFVPKAEPGSKAHTESFVAAKLSGKDWARGLGLAVIAGFVINVNTALTLTIPMMIEGRGLGTAAQSSLVLSAMMLMGILAGLSFRRLVLLFKEWLLSIAMLVFSFLVLLASTASQLLLLGLGAVLSGFCYSIILTIVFNLASEKTPPPLLNQMMIIVLVGCNLGGASSSVLPPLLAQLNPTSSGAFGGYALVGLLLGVVLLLWQKRTGVAKDTR